MTVEKLKKILNGFINYYLKKNTKHQTLNTKH